MNVNVASNNFGDHYINGIFVFGDLDQGDGTVQNTGMMKFKYTLVTFLVKTLLQVS